VNASLCVEKRRRAQHANNPFAIAVKTSYAEIRQRKLPAGRSPVAMGNMYRRLRFAQVRGNGRYVRMVLGDDAVEALAMMP